MRHRLNNLYLIMVALLIGITGCTNSGETQDAAQTDKDFAKTIIHEFFPGFGLVLG